MTPFLKALLRLIVTSILLIAVGVLCFYLVAWAASFFAVPFGIVQVVGFIIALLVIWQIATKVISFFESNPIQ